MDDFALATLVIDKQVLVLNGSSVELMTEDLQKWTKPYKKDKTHVAVNTKLRQGRKYEDFYLTPSGLMAKMVGAQQKIIIPKSLRQQILKECHDVPFTGHVVKTFKLVDRQFHWRGLQGDTIQYMKTCFMCQMMKSNNRCCAPTERCGTTWYLGREGVGKH